LSPFFDFSPFFDSLSLGSFYFFDALEGDFYLSFYFPLDLDADFSDFSPSFFFLLFELFYPGIRYDCFKFDFYLI
jgi:hypothetical protein